MSWLDKCGLWLVVAGSCGGLVTQESGGAGAVPSQPTGMQQSGSPGASTPPPAAGTLDTSACIGFTTTDAVQTSLGSNATQQGAVECVNGMLALTSSWTQPASGAFNPGMLAQLTANGSVIGVPLGVTRQNDAYWNYRVIRTLPPPLNAVPVGLTAFQTWITGVAAAGYTHPLCFGLHDAWVNSHILFEDVVPAVEGPDYSLSYWTGNDTSGGKGMVDALNWAKTYIFPYVSADSSWLSMSAGVNRLMTPPVDPSTQMPLTDSSHICLMTAMGSWGGHQLQAAPDNYVAGTPDNVTAATDFVATGFPGAENLFVYGGYAMVACVSPGHAAQVRATVDIMASPTQQVGCSLLKGDVPARIDLTAAELASLPLLVQVDAKALKTQALPAYRVIGGQPSQYNSFLAMLAQASFQSGDPTMLLAWLTQNYGQIPKQ